MDVQPIVARLTEKLAGLQLREIAAAGGLDDAMRGNKAAPALYVIPLGERAINTDHIGPVDWLERSLFGVVVVVDARDTALNLAQLRRRIKLALVGWVVDDTTGEPVLFQGGELVDFPGDGQLWWSDEFLMTSYFRSEE